MRKLKFFLTFNVILLHILFIYNALAYADLINSEEWEISVDLGYGHGQWTLKENSDALITTDGEWTYVYGGENVKCPFTNAIVEISGQSLSFRATGTATASIAVAGYNTSFFTLNVNGTTSNHSGNGNYSISFNQSGWPSTYSGNWQGNFMSGGGITTTILNTYYRDSDSDGYGDPESPFETEFQSSGYVTDNTDCNDYDSNIHPGSTEIRGDGIDQDCNGSDLSSLSIYYRDSDSDGYGDPENPFEAELQPSGYVTDNTDCNDYDSNIHPGSTEIRGDGIDQDCNGSDLSSLSIYYRDSDSDGYGDPESPFETEFQPSGYVTDNTDCNDYDSSIHPGSAEIRMDGIDQDCDGIDLPKTYSLTQTQVSQLYVSIFGRASEGEGNYYWQRTQDDMILAAKTMLETAAAQRYFGDTLNDNQELIEFIYKNTLGKTYLEDPIGIDFWVAALDDGYSKAQIIASLINSVMDPKYVGNPAQDRFINMVTVSNYCAEKISTVPDVNDLSAFIGFISSITNNPLTVITAEANVDAF